MSDNDFAAQLQAAVARHTLKTSHDRDLAGFKRGGELFRWNVVYPRPAVRAVGDDGDLPAHP